MPTDHDHHPGLEQRLGTVGEAMTTPVLVLDADTPADVTARQLAEGAARAAGLHRGRVLGGVRREDLISARAEQARAGPAAADRRLERVDAGRRR